MRRSLVSAWRTSAGLSRTFGSRMGAIRRSLAAIKRKVRDSQSYEIDLYMMKLGGPAAVGESNLARGSVEAFYRKNYRVSRILEIDAWCHMHPGLKKRVNFANFRLSPPFASPYLVRSSRVAFNDYKDE